MRGFDERGEREANLDLRPCFVPQCDRDRDRLLFKSSYPGRKGDVSDLQTPKIFDSSIIRSYVSQGVMTNSLL